VSRKPSFVFLGVDLIELVRQLNEKPGKCSLSNNLRETIVAFDVPTIVSYSRELSPSNGTLVGEFCVIMRIQRQT